VPPVPPPPPPPDVFDVTCKLTLPELLLSGFGFRTLIANVPADEAKPVAVSDVDETKVVVNGELASHTCAPLTKFPPLTVMLKLPLGTDAGATLFTTGTGFSSVTEVVPEAPELAALTALTVTVFEVGRLLGGA
jgi:hypothetical protein